VRVLLEGVCNTQLGALVTTAVGTGLRHAELLARFAGMTLTSTVES
jgi:hypothetical protein